MAQDISITASLDAKGVEIGATAAQSAIEKLGRGAKGLGRQLELTHQRLLGGEDAATAFKISLAKISDEERRTLQSMLERNTQLKQQQELERNNALAVQQSAKQAQDRADKLRSLISASEAEVRALNKSTQALKLEEAQRLGATRAQLSQLQANQKTIASYERLIAIQSQTKRIGAIGLGVAGVASAGSIIQMADDWTVLTNRLKLVHEEMSDVQNAQKGIVDVARETGASLSETAQVYQRFAMNQKQLKLSNEDLLRITLTVNKAISIGGSSAESSSAALAQFGQALASGVLRGEEFNSVMEQAPGLAQALATGLNVPIGSLRQLATEGKLTSDKLISALQKASSTVDEDFKKTAMTISSSMEA